MGNSRTKVLRRASSRTLPTAKGPAARGSSETKEEEVSAEVAHAGQSVRTYKISTTPGDYLGMLHQYLDA